MHARRFLISRRSGVLHLGRPNEACNSDQIARKDRLYFASEREATRSEHYTRRCWRCFGVPHMR
jgi:hypothetical protein